MVSLDLVHYGLDGFLPNDIFYDLNTPTEIVLRDNRIKGSIPDIRYLKNLKTLNLEINEFTCIKIKSSNYF